MARQGLPRTAGAGGAAQAASPAGAASGAAAPEIAPEAAPTGSAPTGQATTGQAPSGQAPSGQAPATGRRQGLPRPGAASVATAATPVAEASEPVAASAPASAAAPAAPAAGSRRQGMPRPGAAPVAPAAASVAQIGASVGAPAAPDEAPAVVTITRPATAPAAQANAGRRPLLRAGLLAVALVVLAGVAVLVARWLVTLEGVQGFLAAYPGETELPHGAPVGLPAWLGWQHFFNVFLMVLIIRSGWQVRTQRRPPASWTPRWGKNPKKISITLWLHQSLDILWLVNGAVFVVLLLATGQWMRVVPTSWEVFPNAVSAALQYLSLDWPTENGWVNYNSLQVLAYFATIFLAAPLAAVTGYRMSAMWPARAKRLSTVYPIELARAIHLPVMLYFVGFILVHVALVLSTGALRNLNHMYAGQDAVNWVGFGIFALSLLVIVGGWLAARPLVLAPLAGLFGTVGR